jgi:hypothetical protein
VAIKVNQKGPRASASRIKLDTQSISSKTRPLSDMAPCSTTGLSLRSCYAPPAKGAQPMLSKPMFDDFNDLVIAADEAAVCEVSRHGTALLCTSGRTAAVRVLC